MSIIGSLEISSNATENKPAAAHGARERHRYLCQTTPCWPSGQLSVSVGILGYEGERCQFLVDHCLSQPCKNGATCFSSQAGPRCYCTEGELSQLKVVRSKPRSSHISMGVCVYTFRAYK